MMFFDSAVPSQVPKGNLLGKEGKGFQYLYVSQELLVFAIIYKEYIKQTSELISRMWFYGCYGCYRYMMQNFNHERFAFCAMSTRFARVCLEDSLKFAGKRKTFGKTLIQHPVIRWKVAEMARQIEATHNWLEWITFQLNTMPKLEAMLKLGGHTALCKVQCTKAGDPEHPTS